MEIRGREIKFLRTVKATCDIVELAPDHDIERIGELFDGDLSKTLVNGAKVVHILNEGYEMNRAFNEDGYKPQIISVEEVLYLDQDQYEQLVSEAMNAMSNGAEQMVELEDTKKNKVTR